MTELNWNLSWTLATIGLCWLFMSCAVALALGRIIQRSKAGGVVAQGSDARRAEELGIEDESDVDETGCRAASGTRLKPVSFQEEAAPKRKVS
jgi:hypothetical protein